MIFISCIHLARPKSSLWYPFNYSNYFKRTFEQNLFFEKKFFIRPFLKVKKSDILESFSDSHYYEELMNVSNYKPKILKQDFNETLYNTSGYNSKQNSYFNNMFEDDVAFRIDQLNQSLIRIKALNREISLKNGTNFPILHFD